MEDCVSTLPRPDETLNIDEYVLEIVRDYRPETVEQLIELVQRKFPQPKFQIMERVIKLQSLGRISLREHPYPSTSRLGEYIFSSKAYWYWITVAVTITTAILVFMTPEYIHTIVLARYIFGSLFVLWLPGYTFIKMLFPKRELDHIERAALSIGMSLAIVPIVGLLLNFTPWGITLTPITLSLLALTSVFATTAIMREYQACTQQPQGSAVTSL